MIGGWFLVIGALAVVVGAAIAYWEFNARFDDHAPIGKWTLIVAAMLLLFGGIVTCTDTMIEVQKLKRDYPASIGRE